MTYISSFGSLFRSRNSLSINDPQIIINLLEASAPLVVRLPRSAFFFLGVGIFLLSLRIESFSPVCFALLLIFNALWQESNLWPRIPLSTASAALWDVSSTGVSSRFILTCSPSRNTVSLAISIRSRRWRSSSSITAWRRASSATPTVSRTPRRSIPRR